MIVVEWMLERISARVFVPLAVGLAVAAGAPVLSGAGCALVLVVAFRLRDDLADADTDSLDRVLPRAISRRPFWAAYGVLLAVCATFAPGVLALALAFELAYRSELGGRHRWVLLKYPVFVFLLGGRRAATAALVYFVIGVHERLTDPSLRTRPDNARRVLALTFAATVALGAHLL